MPSLKLHGNLASMAGRIEDPCPAGVFKPSDPYCSATINDNEDHPIKNSLFITQGGLRSTHSRPWMPSATDDIVREGNELAFIGHLFGNSVLWGVDKIKLAITIRAKLIRTVWSIYVQVQEKSDFHHGAMHRHDL
jgi:hypothetical protein